MTDSCSARKLDPGFETTYSKPSVFRTSIMKSDPGRSVVCTSTLAGAAVSAAATLAEGEGAAARRGSAFWAFATGGFATSAAAPARNPRRPTDIFLDLAMLHSSGKCGDSHRISGNL